MKLLYLLGTFPRISSEACIMNEIIEIKKEGHGVTILAGDREYGRYHREIYEYDLLKDTIHFREYKFLQWNLFNRYKSNYKKNRRFLGAVKILDFISKITFDLIRHPSDSFDSIRTLIRTHNNIFSISDTYLGYRKIKGRPDLIHVQFPHLNHLSQAQFLSEKFDCPFTLIFRALDLHEKSSKKQLRMKKGILKRSKRIITISEFNRDIIKKEFDMDAVVIHSSINTDKFKPGTNEESTKKPGRIIYTGRFVEKKGIEYLLEACYILGKRGVKFDLLLIGNGPMKGEYQKRIRNLGIENYITFKDLIPQEEIIDELGQSEIFVLPSIVTEIGDTDILPNSLKEAMAMELPGVTTDISGIQELVENGKSGLITKPKDPSAIADAIEMLLEDEKIRRKMGAVGRKKIKKEFNIKIEARKLIDVFEKVID